jgi:hypothetical protein
MKIDPSDLVKGPIRHETLSDEMVSRVRAIRAALLRVYPQTMGVWLDGFKRDMHPEKEILWWEHLSACFLEYFWTKCQNEQQAKAALRLLFQIGMSKGALRLLFQIGMSGDPPGEFGVLPEDHVDFLRRSAAFAYPPPDTKDEAS